MDLQNTNIVNKDMDNTKLSENLAKPVDHLNMLQLDADVLRRVGEMISAQMNDQLVAIAAHANAGLQWLSHDPPRLENARSSLERIASATNIVADILNNHRAHSPVLGSRFALDESDI